MAKKKAKGKSKVKPAPKRAAKPRAGTPAPTPAAAAPVREAPRYNAEGVLLNPEACQTSSDGVVSSK